MIASLFGSAQFASFEAEMGQGTASIGDAKVVEFTNSNPAILKFNIGDLTTNAGTPQEIQTGFTAVVKKQNFPT